MAGNVRSPDGDGRNLTFQSIGYGVRHRAAEYANPLIEQVIRYPGQLVVGLIGSFQREDAPGNFGEIGGIDGFGWVGTKDKFASVVHRAALKHPIVGLDQAAPDDIPFPQDLLSGAKDAVYLIFLFTPVGSRKSKVDIALPKPK